MDNLLTETRFAGSLSRSPPPSGVSCDTALPLELSVGVCTTRGPWCACRRVLRRRASLTASRRPLLPERRRTGPVFTRQLNTGSVCAVRTCWTGAQTNTAAAVGGNRLQEPPRAPLSRRLLPVMICWR